MIREKSICIMSFSPIYQDARVLRQVKYLSSHYDLTVIGYGPPPEEWVNKRNIKWISLDFGNLQDHRKVQSLKSKFCNWITEALPPILKKLKLFLSYCLLALGRLHPRFYEIWYWRTKYRLKTLRYGLQSGCHAFHANDWDALPAAAVAAKRRNAKLIFDAHEYAPLELENRWYWKPFFQPAITYFLRKYSPQMNASVTVAPLISKRYKNEFGFDAKVILNAPEAEPLLLKQSNFTHIRLVHHGGAIRDRRLEKLIETLSLCDRRFSLHFLLLKNDPHYLKYLIRLANMFTPGRVIFNEPVPPDQIVRRISEFDMGFYLLEPNSYNNISALPNKFFDYIAAGLALCIGPSPSMAEIVRQYGLGCIAPSFEPRRVAETLNRLTAEELLRMQLASQQAAKELNAKIEMNKLIDLYDRLFE